MSSRPKLSSMSSLLPAKGGATIPEHLPVSQLGSQPASQHAGGLSGGPAGQQDRLAAERLGVGLASQPEVSPASQTAGGMAGPPDIQLAIQPEVPTAAQPALPPVVQPAVQQAAMPARKPDIQRAAPQAREPAVPAAIQQAAMPAREPDMQTSGLPARLRSSRDEEARTTVSARLPLSLQRRLRECAHQREVQKQDIIEVALDQFLAREGF